jgi:hypothetical protein
MKTRSFFPHWTCALLALALVAVLAQVSAAQPASSPSTTYTLVDTGQITCYDDSVPIACPEPGDPFFGQDAQHDGTQPDYVDHGDGTVTDLNTGLMWQQGYGGKMTWDEAVASAESFTLAGYDDWRLPTIDELYSLIDFSGIDPSGCDSEADCPHIAPFIDTTYFDFVYGDPGAGERLIDAQYWSGTEYVGTTMDGRATAFGVNFADGRIKGYPTDTVGPPDDPFILTAFVRYVRGNPDYGANDFVDNGDGTIADRATGLMWSQADSSAGMNWEEALAWVEQRNAENYLGYSDWRLPDAKELQSIVDYTRAPSVTGSAAIDPLFGVTPIVDEGGNTNYPFYWTSTTHASWIAPIGQSGVYVAFGEALGWMRQPGGEYVLMDVHGAGAQRCDFKSGDPSDWPYGHGPQGDVVRVDNYVRLVRDAGPPAVLAYGLYLPLVVK